MTRKTRIKLLALGAITGLNAIALHKARVSRENQITDTRTEFDTQAYSNRYNHY